MEQIKWLDGMFRGVSTEDMNLDARIIKALFRRGDRVRGEGVLANYVLEGLKSERFQASIARLEQFKFIEVSTGFTSRRVKLLAYDVAAQLIGKDQLDEKDKADKEYKERFQNQE
jgi:hypothetical protein